MTTETCENCGRTIGNLEPRFLFNEQVVCNECDKVLRNVEPVKMEGVGVPVFVDDLEDFEEISPRIDFDEKKFSAWQEQKALDEKQQTDKNTLNGVAAVVAVIAAIVLLPFVNFFCNCTESPTDAWVSTEGTSRGEDAGDVDLSIQAYRLAKEYVTEQLKCPSTAKFLWFAEDLTPFNNQIYVMRSYVDSENGFGAMIRTHFVIKIQFIRSDDDSQWNWKVLLFETT